MNIYWPSRTISWVKKRSSIVGTYWCCGKPAGLNDGPRQTVVTLLKSLPDLHSASGFNTSRASRFLAFPCAHIALRENRIKIRSLPLSWILWFYPPSLKLHDFSTIFFPLGVRKIGIPLCSILFRSLCPLVSIWRSCYWLRYSQRRNTMYIEWVTKQLRRVH